MAVLCGRDNLLCTLIVLLLAGITPVFAGDSYDLAFSTYFGGGNWEGQIRWGVDDPNGSDNYDRWVNVYTDSGDGTDRVVADSGLIDVAAGPHTFYFVGRLYSGSGTVELFRPALTVLVPAGQVYLPLVRK